MSTPLSPHFSLEEPTIPGDGQGRRDALGAAPRRGRRPLSHAMPGDVAGLTPATATA